MPKKRKIFGISMSIVMMSVMSLFVITAEAAPNFSTGKELNVPGFDARGEALQKVVTNLIGQAPNGVPSSNAGKPIGTKTNGINFNGGAVMTSPIKVNIIWYGTWQDPKKSILRDLVTGLSGSPYFNINTTYYDAAKNPVINSLTLGQEITDNYSLGNGGSTGLSDQQIWAIVSNAASKSATNKAAIENKDAITLVLTSSDVKKSGFLTNYCGWHSYSTLNGVVVKYSFVGDPGTNSGCAAQQTSPNGDTGADAMASVIAHEIEEAATDPQLNAWFDSRGYENADKCAWNFGAFYTNLNGSKYNMTLGSRNYYIQQNWVNAGGGYCALKY